ncbi:MAG: hypothetical protein KGM44_05680, partial [bacterium]|nr:hypothetical protein [bacterium]
MRVVITLSTQQRLLAAIASARRIDAAVYLPAGGFARALAGAARRGAAVTLHVAGTMPPGSSRERALDAMLPALRAAGVHIVLERDAIEHLKAVVIDGREGYLADRNFARDETLLRTDEADAVGAAIDHRPARSRDILLGTKGEVQDAEAALVRAAPAGTEVLAVSEFANDSAVVRAMLARAGQLRETLIVGATGAGLPAEARALAALAAKGVRVEVAQIAEKGLCIGAETIVTSANDSVGQPSMR